MNGRVLKQTRKLRVLHVIAELGQGGAEALLFRIATRKSEVEHEVVALVGPGWYTPRLEASGVRVHHLGAASALAGPRIILDLIRIIKTSEADVVHAWMYGPNLVASLAAKYLRVPIVWAIHSSTLDGLSLPTRLAARVGGFLSGQLPDKILNCSARSAQLHERLGFATAATEVVYNGFDPGVFFPDDTARDATRRSLGIDAQTFVAGCIGRWNVRKDIPNLVSALEIIAAKHQSMCAVLIGGGLDGANSDLMQRIGRVGPAVTVLPLGHQPYIERLARAMDVHVLPSATEAFPNVIAETMLSGTPNIVTDVGDAAFIVGETGWVVPRGDPAALSKAIETAYDEHRSAPALWSTRRANARKRIMEHFTFDKMAETYERIWRDVKGA